MALEQPHGIFGKVTTVFATKLKSFSFVPLLKRLPVENRVIPTWTKEPKISQEPGDSELSKTDTGIYKTEVYNQDHEEEEELGETFTMTIQSEIQSTDYLQPNSPTKLAGPYVESDSITPKPSPVPMETIDNKHHGISHLGFHNTSVGAEFRPGLVLNSPSQREEVLSPVSSIDFFTSPTSSKESILSEGWDKERSWSALHMLSRDASPALLSRTLSPCSSIRSGAFTPSVVRIKRHALAPGSSLLQMSPTCGTPSCDSRTTSPCPLSPRARHRPPPSQLSLLTAILRKGRLPVLSSAFERPYTPCWPITSVSMSSCLACSAASAVAPINVSKAKTCSSVDRPCRESRQNLPDHSSLTITSLASAPDKGPPKLPERLISCQHVAGSSSIALPTECSHLTSRKPGHKDNCLPTAPGPLSCTSFSHIRSLSPKSNTLYCCSSDKPPSTSWDRIASVDPNKSFASFILSDDLKSHTLSEKDLLTLNQGQQSSDLSAELSLKDKGSSSDHFVTYSSKPARSLCETSFFPTPKSRESHDNSSPMDLSHTMNKPDTLHQNGHKSDVERVCLSSPAFRQSPSSRPVGLTCLSYTPPTSPAYPSAQLYSSTPERCTRSPGVPSRPFSTSPSYSLCSSPSPSLWSSSSDCTDGKNRKTYKIKSTYKALAAIPTNTLLQEQQAIDDDVNKNEASFSVANSYAWEDPHSEMCSPAQLRQQSAELYATIDQVLEDPIQEHQSHHVKKATEWSTAAEAPWTSSPSPKPLGRETKYAKPHLQNSALTAKTLTKPGVIKPVTVICRLTDNKDVEELHPKPFISSQESSPSQYQYRFVRNTVFGAESRSSSDQQSDGRAGPSPERQEDSKTILAPLITQRKSSPNNVQTSINTLERHLKLYKNT
ncbi:uncharacterized protein mlip isoform X2 [Misgurnus anguillicaudatus]|uniref:uncharacterized protein mlip isoform X2 n=1 Tax=Misgurnus anguillicaudatus TaxID=75329 RepID=UPI003CCF6565